MSRRALDVGDTQRHVVARIAAAMDERGISIRALAAQIGISHTRISYLLRSQRAITVDEMTDMCAAVGIDAWRVLHEVESLRPTTSSVTALPTGRVGGGGYGDGDVADPDSPYGAAALDYGDDPEQEALEQAEMP